MLISLPKFSKSSKPEGLLKSDVETDIIITSVEGKIVSNAKNTKEVDLSHIKAGMYFITVLENNTGV